MLAELLFIVASWNYSQAVSAKSEFLRQYAPHEEKVREVYGNLQLTSRYIEHYTDESGKLRERKEYHEFLSNGGLMRSEVTALEDGSGILQRCHLLNSLEGSFLCSRADRDSEYLISARMTDADCFESIAVFCPESIAAYGCFGMTLRSIVELPDTQVQGFSEINEGGQRRLRLVLVTDANVHRYEGVFDLDPAGHWVILGFEWPKGRLGSVNYEGRHNEVPLVRSALYQSKSLAGELRHSQDMTIERYLLVPPPKNRFTVADLDVDYVANGRSGQSWKMWTMILVGVALLVAGSLIARTRWYK